MPEIKTEVMTVNMGPQHPSTHGVLRLVLELDGETVVSASPTIGYLHTGIEKTTEQKKWQQVIPLVERMDYLSAQSNSMAFCLSVETLLGIEFDGHPDPRRLLMPEDWDGFPLRKDYPVQIRKVPGSSEPLQMTAEEFRANVQRDRLSRRD